MRKLKDLVKGTLKSVLTSVAVLVALMGVAVAQVPSANPPYNVDLGGSGTTVGTPLITNTARSAGTLNSAQQNNLDKVGVICVFSLTASSGSPTVNFAVQNYDAASQTYSTVVASGVQTPIFSQPLTISVKPGNQLTSLPTGYSAAASFPLARFWRVQQILAGSANPTTTGTLSCNVVK